MRLGSSLVGAPQLAREASSKVAKVSKGSIRP